MAIFEKTIQVRGFQFVPSTAEEIDLMGSEAYAQEKKIEAELPGFYIRRAEIRETLIWGEPEGWDEATDSFVEATPDVTARALYISQDWYFEGARQVEQYELTSGQWLVEDSSAYSGYRVMTEAEVDTPTFRKL